MSHPLSERSTSRRSLLKGLVAGGGLAALAIAAPSAAFGRSATAHQLGNGAAAAPTAPMRYGMGWTADPFATTYAAQVAAYNATTAYVYWVPNGTNPSWSRDCADVPDDHDIVLQFTATGRAKFDATLATFPQTRTGKVYVHHLNEPEDDIERGTFTLLQWQKRTDALYAAVDAANLPYVVKSVGLAEWTLHRWANGGQPATGPRNPSNYIRPGCQHVGLSLWNTPTKIVNGHAVAHVDPAVQAKRCGDFAVSKGLQWSSTAAGMSLPSAYLQDAASVQNRVTWLKGSAAACAANGARHYSWFDQTTSTGTFRFADDAALKAAWLSMAPAPIPPMRYGMGGTADPFDATYASQVSGLAASNVYVYWPPNGTNPGWSRNCSNVPDDHDIILQLKATTRAEYDATFATFPKTRTGKVYVHHWNEPEDQVESGQFTLAQWQARTDAMYAAIDAANLPYVVKSVELMEWTIQLWDQGGQSATGARNPNNYIRPGCQHIAISVYAGVKIVNGHAVPKADAVTQAERCGDFAKSRQIAWSNAAGGMALPTAQMSDAVSIQNRVDWLKASGPACEANGAVHYNWFDLAWSNGNYKLGDDPALKSAWLELAG